MFKAITIADEKVTGTLTDFVIFVKPSVIDGWDTLTLAEVESMRWYADEAKTVELASHPKGADEIYVKVNTLTDSTTIYVDYDGSRSKYAADDTYGSEAVWSGEGGVWLLDDLTTSTVADSTANGFTGTKRASNSPIEATGKVGQGQDFSNGDDYIEVSPNVNWDNQNRVLRFWANSPNWNGADNIVFNSEQNQFAIAAGGHFSSNGVPGGTASGVFLFTADGNVPGPGVGGFISDSELTANTWHKFSLVVDSDNEIVAVYVDGSPVTLDVDNGWFPDEGTMIGARRASAPERFFNGLIDHLKLRQGTWSAAEEEAEYNNENDPASFFATVTDADGGNPNVATQEATSVTKTGATLNGELTSLGEETDVDVFFEYRVQGAGTWETTTTQNLTATGTFEQALTELDPDTTYEFRAVVTWDSGSERKEGSTLTFDTDPLDPPAVTTNAASGVGTTTATLNGDLTDLGDFDPVQARFQYRVQGAGEWLLTAQQERSATGTYSQGLSGLADDTTYEFRAMVEYGDNEEVFGSTLTFTTDEPAGATTPSVTTNAMTEIRATYATANGDVTSDGGEAVTERGFVWATTTAPDVNDNKVEVDGTTGEYSVKLNDLPPETLIYVRTYAINAEGTSYGNEVEFTTLSLEDVRNPVYIKDGDNLRRI